jgi:Spy/CpxP family protein refolding chaperone
MRRIIGALGCALLFAVAAPVGAQGAPQLSAEQWLAKIQADKKGIVERSMNLAPAEAKKFWPLYEQFQRELAVPQSQINRAMLDYIAAGDKLTDAEARRIVEQVQAGVQDEARLYQKHFKQLLKVLPAKQAARYMQIENKMQAVVRYEAAKAFPLVP